VEVTSFAVNPIAIPRVIRNSTTEKPDSRRANLQSSTPHKSEKLGVCWAEGERDAASLIRHESSL
jgi:hypothetical protein